MKTQNWKPCWRSFLVLSFFIKISSYFYELLCIIKSTIWLLFSKKKSYENLEFLHLCNSTRLWHPSDSVILKKNSSENSYIDSAPEKLFSFTIFKQGKDDWIQMLKGILKSVIQYKMKDVFLSCHLKRLEGNGLCISDINSITEQTLHKILRWFSWH